MANVKVYLGKQTAEKTKATAFTDLGATDFNIEESIQMIQSEVFQNVQAAGDSDISKIEVGGSVPIELSMKTLELILPGLSYKETTRVFKMSTDKPSYYTLVLEDVENNQKYEYIDAQINVCNINVATGAYVTADLDFICKDLVIGTGTVTTPTARGVSLRSLYSQITLDGAEITDEIESLSININNGLESAGAINSIYNVRTRRATPQTTTIDFEKNLFDKTDFTAVRTKMLAGTTATAVIKLGDGSKEVTIDVLKAKITANSRGDLKGAGSNSVSVTCSADNADSSHLKITMPALT